MTAFPTRLVRNLLTHRDEAHRPCDRFEAWWAGYVALSERWEAPFDRAVVGGFQSDRLAYAFAGAYQAAGRRLCADLPPDQVFSLCVTEEGGAHPRAIESTLTEGIGGWILNGRKRWVTLGPRADILLVAATEGVHPDGRPRIRMVRVDPSVPSVGVSPMPKTPFAPEIDHAFVDLDHVPVTAEDILFTDGYQDCVKPFRTVEDMFVAGAVLGHLAGVAARFRWPREVAERIAQLVYALRALTAAPPLQPCVHVVLGGQLAAHQRLLKAITPHWERVDADVRARWKRDQPLLAIAQQVRSKRLERAWETLSE